MPDTLVRAFGLRGLSLHSDLLANDRFRWVKQHLPASMSAARVLDAGCGNGMFTMLAASRGADALGLSDSKRELDDATRRSGLLGLDARFELQDLRRIDEREDLVDFDVVVCLEVIEHVLDDAALLTRLAALARPGALLLLSTPTDDHPALFGEREHLSGVEDGRHVRWGSSPDRLRTVCAQAGWEVERIEKISGPISRRSTSLGYRVGQRSRVLGWASTLWARPLVSLDRRMLRSSARSHCWGVVARRRTLHD